MEEKDAMIRQQFREEEKKILIELVANKDLEVTNPERFNELNAKLAEIRKRTRRYMLNLNNNEEETTRGGR